MKSGSRRRENVLIAAAALPFLFILTLPFFARIAPGEGAWGAMMIYDRQRIAVVTVLAIMALLVGTATRREESMPMERNGFLLGIVALAWGLCSIAANDVPWRDGLREVGLMALLLSAFWSIRIAFYRIDPAEWQRMVALTLLGSVVLYLVGFFDTHARALVEIGPHFPVFSNIRFFSDYQAFVLPFAIHAVTVLCRHPLARLAGWGVLFLFLMLFFLSGSRVIVLGQLAAHLSLLAMLGRRHFPTLRRHALAWIGGYGLYWILTRSGLSSGSVPNPLIRSGLSGRDDLWLIAWRHVETHPWLGIGPGEFSRSLNGIAAAPHNGLAMAGAEWGLPVLALLAGAIAVMTTRVLRALRSASPAGEGPEGFPAAAWLSFCALLAHSFVANVWVIPISQLGFCLSAALVYASCLDSRDGMAARPPARAFPVGKTLLPLAVLAGASMAWVLIRDVPKLPERNLAYLQCQKSATVFSPRFWQQGWLGDGCPGAAP